MAISLSAPRHQELKPRIVVFGVGGAGGNAVNNMIEAGLEGVEFVVANTDAQQLQFSRTEARIQLGVGITMGLGAGAHPEVGMTAAEESSDTIAEHLEGAHMVFITAGMGGGTGTGAAPIIAKCARERGILTVGVVTKPFTFEGRHRMRLADAGISELQRYVDTLIVIPNQNLFRIANERTTFAEAFGMADQVLHAGVRSITDLMVLPGLINLDFADVRSVMSDMGKAMMGTGEASGEDRALLAAQNAIQNPLLDETSLKGAKAVLVNVTGGLDMTLHEVDEAANAISSEVDPEANIIFGAAFDPALEGKLRVSVVATGMDGVALQTPLTTTQVKTQTPAPTFGLGYASRQEQPAPQPAPSQPIAPAAERTAAPAPAAAPSAPAAPRSSLFEAAPAAQASAPQPAPAPVVEEPQVIRKIVDPMAMEDLPAAATPQPAPAITPAPRVEPQISRPNITRPNAYGTQAPVQQPAAQQPRPAAPAPAPRLNTEEEGRESFWRGLFPQRQRNDFSPVGSQASAEDEADRYQPAPAKSSASSVSPAAKPVEQPSADAEDDLEIPSFLRRLAN
ncbi:MULTISPECIES: cell division protein FtsZ [Asticcacaulis]|uniref:cell division protein FtsZ n=1 Tax=Asticcacaulis TaxID=76890 RepID=UPI001AE451A5|nr:MULTISPECIES: cell division protein FtsZ [Asticcacaulis]MBP2159423.1 cell division protein FtsZ [Asticcacaulis solisilvae]MDR6800750.1 cell division protein FtsZ [Asticcacaulis sp. BE141]